MVNDSWGRLGAGGFRGLREPRHFQRYKKVRQKLEPPLRNLWFGGGEREIGVTAYIDLRGHDLSGNALQATGQLQIFFADFVDE